MIIAPGIHLYDDVLIDSKSIMEDIEDAVEKKILNWYRAGVESGSGDTVNANIRDTYSIGVPFNINSVPSGMYEESMHFLNKYFCEGFSPLISKYLNEYKIDINEYQNYEILKYGAGQKFDEHVDSSDAYPRKVSLTYYANDDYTGGEIEFTRFNLKIKPKPHQLLLFPSHAEYAHKVHPVIDGTRYAVVQWMN